MTKTQAHGPAYTNFSDTVWKIFFVYIPTQIYKIFEDRSLWTTQIFSWKKHSWLPIFWRFIFEQLIERILKSRVKKRSIQMHSFRKWNKNYNGNWWFEIQFRKFIYQISLAFWIFSPLLIWLSSRQHSAKTVYDDACYIAPLIYYLCA